jgi:cobalt/nickel transport system permease protein
MGVAGTWATFFAHRAMRRLSAAAAVFTATVLGCLATFMFTMLQLAMALPDPLLVSVTRLGGVFLVSELPLAVLEAMLTVFVVRSLPANAFLRERTGAAC